MTRSTHRRQLTYASLYPGHCKSKLQEITTKYRYHDKNTQGRNTEEQKRGTYNQVRHIL